MAKKKKKKGTACRAVVAAGAAVMFASLTGCKFIEDWSAGTPDPDPIGTGTPQAGGTVPVPGSGIEVDALDIATWVLAALGLGPVARLVGASRPLVAPLIALLFGTKKPKPPVTETPAQ